MCSLSPKWSVYRWLSLIISLTNYPRKHLRKPAWSGVRDLATLGACDVDHRGAPLTFERAVTAAHQNKSKYLPARTDRPIFTRSPHRTPRCEYVVCDERRRRTGCERACKIDEPARWQLSGAGFVYSRFRSPVRRERTERVRRFRSSGNGTVGAVFTNRKRF